MKTAIDSSILFSILKGEESSEDWLSLLEYYSSISQLVICDIVAAEVAGLFSSIRKFKHSLEDLNIKLDHVNLDTCFLVSKIFRSYRKEGGKRKNLIPDFIIGAHALKQADVLLANDRGYLRKYFSKLKVVGI